MIEIGIDSFAATFPDPSSGETLPPATRMANLLAEIETADRAGSTSSASASTTGPSSSTPRPS